MENAQERKRLLGEARSRYLSGSGTLREVAKEFGLTYGAVSRASAKDGWYGDRLMRRRILSLEKDEFGSGKGESVGAGAKKALKDRSEGENVSRKGAAESAEVIAGEVAGEAGVVGAGKNKGKSGGAVHSDLSDHGKKHPCGGNGDSGSEETSHFDFVDDASDGENGGDSVGKVKKAKKKGKKPGDRSSGEAVDKLRQIVLGLEKAMAEAVEGDIFIEHDGGNVIFDGKLFKEAVQAAKILCDSVRDAWDIPTYSESLKKEALDKGDSFDGVFSVRFEGGGEDYAG